MKRVFLIVRIVVVWIAALALAGCDTTPPKPKTQTEPAVTQVGLVDKLLKQLPDSLADSQAKAEQAAAELERRTYQALADGKLQLACRNSVQRSAQQQALCREQNRAGAEFLSFVQMNQSKRSTVLSSRDDADNPWRWQLAGEACWSADCIQAQQLRAVAQRCGAPVPRALEAQCIYTAERW